jgi:PPOX class probable F420-dependent enzyme
MRRMTEEEWRAFVMEGTRTGKLATARPDGRPHVVPVWFVLDGEDVVFSTAASSVKGRALRRDRRACLCVDDQAPPFSFVMLDGVVTLGDDLGELRVGDPHRRALHGRRPRPGVRRAQRRRW